MKVFFFFAVGRSPVLVEGDEAAVCLVKPVGPVQLSLLSQLCDASASCWQFSKGVKLGVRTKTQLTLQTVTFLQEELKKPRTCVQQKEDKNCQRCAIRILTC